MNTTSSIEWSARQCSSGNASTIGTPLTSRPTLAWNSSLAHSTTNPGPRYVATAANVRPSPYRPNSREMNHERWLRQLGRQEKEYPQSHNSRTACCNVN